LEVAEMLGRVRGFDVHVLDNVTRARFCLVFGQG
jgi:hypothetical protein